MQVRPYLDSDYLAVLDIYAHSKLDEFAAEPGEFTLLPLHEDHDRLAAFHASEVLVCEDGEVLGFAAISGNKIHAMFVRPEARRLGVGRRLMEYILPRMTGKVSLNVAKSNLPAKRLYQSFGFAVARDFETHYNRTPVWYDTMVRDA